jgi:hypothetical protein
MSSKKYLKAASASLPFKLTVTNILLLLLAGGLIFMALKSAHIIEGATTVQASNPVSKVARAVKARVAKGTKAAAKKAK